MSPQRSFPKHVVASALLAGSLAALSPAHAANLATFTGVTGHGVPALGLAIPDLVVNVAGISSYDGLGAAVNTVLTLAAQPGAVVDMLTWSVNLSTVGLSWLSEAGVMVTNSNGDGVIFNPGSGDEFAGTKSYTGGGSLAAEGAAFSVLADGKLFMQFFETWVDNPGAPDATYLSGNITLSAVAVPEPATYGLLGLGLVGVALAAGRRRAVPARSTAGAGIL